MILLKKPYHIENRKTWEAKVMWLEKKQKHKTIIPDLTILNFRPKL